MFVRTLDENILMIKVRTERDKSPTKWSLEFDLNEDQDVHWRRKTMKVSLTMLKIYCYES